MGNRSRSGPIGWTPDAAFGAGFARAGCCTDWFFHGGVPVARQYRRSVMINPYKIVCQDKSVRCRMIAL